MNTLAAVDWAPLRLSFGVAAIAALVAFAAGVPLAWLLARRAFRGRSIVEALATLPLVLPPTVLGYYLLVAFGRHTFLGRGYEALTGSPLTFTVHGAVLASVIHAVPLLVRTARASIESVDTVYERAARTLGAGEWRIAWTVTLPLARPGLVAATTLAFARALGEFGVTLMVAGNIPGETRTAALAIYDALQAGHDAEAQALVCVLSAIALVVLAVMSRAQSRGRDE
jgi:molybdate transport system permease protein